MVVGLPAVKKGYFMVDHDGRGHSCQADQSLNRTCGNMNPKKSVIMALVLVLTAAFASAAEPVWPRDSASEFSIFVALLRFRIQADHCSAKVPQLKPGFESLVEDLNRRVQGISKGLLASGAFQGMKDTPVPADILDAFKDSFEDVRHNFERREAASICQKTLQDLREVDDNSLKSDLSGILTAVQNMIRKLEKGSR